MADTSNSISIGKVWFGKIIRLVLAVIIYTFFGVLLYCPHFRCFEKIDYLVLVNLLLASSGCYILSSRWIGSFWAKLFSGILYGFGPFMLGLSKFHSTAGFLAAAIPWAFLPAAFCYKKKWKFLQWPLSAIPFVGIIAFFNLTAHLGLFPASIQCRLQTKDLISLFAPLVYAGKCSTLLGFYHVPVAALIMGISMLIVGRRFGIMIIFLTGLIPAFCPSIINVSPILWLSIPILCCAVMVGEGIQGLSGASYADRKWVFFSALIMGVLSLFALLLATQYFQGFAGMGDKHASLFLETARMYILGMVAVTISFLIARGKVRLYWLRLVILCSAMAIDIYFSSQILVDKVI
jgi:hypothetical protein